MGTGSGWRKYGAVRWFSVIAVGVAVMITSSRVFEWDMSRGSATRYAVLVPLGVLAVVVLKVWERVSPRTPRDRG